MNLILLYLKLLQKIFWMFVKEMELKKVFIFMKISLIKWWEILKRSGLVSGWILLCGVRCSNSFCIKAVFSAPKIKFS